MAGEQFDRSTKMGNAENITGTTPLGILTRGSALNEKRQAIKNKQNISSGDIAFYQSPNGEVRLDVMLEHETVWLSLNQISKLFDRDKSVISRHLRTIYSSGELEKEATIAKNATVQKEGGREVEREIEYYNLDAILSVGYRINSQRGTQFRIWATRTLRDHLIQGYTLNKNRLREQGVEIGQVLDLLSRTLTDRSLAVDEGRSVLDVVRQYVKTWRLLLEYDEDRLTITVPPAKSPFPGEALPLEAARKIISHLRNDLASRGQATALFGCERGDSLSGILAAIGQTFAGESLYESVQMRAAHLLYFIIKDHPFSDGNKRIGTLLFLEYLKSNGLFLKPDGSLRLTDNTMVALALLVAESAPVQKDLMIRLIVNLLEEDRKEE